MANSKISALTSATTPLAGTETLPVVQSSTTKQVSVANLTAGRAVDTASVSTTAGYTFYGANNTLYPLMRYVGGTNNPGVFAKVLEASSYASLFASGSNGALELWLGGGAVEGVLKLGGANATLSTGNLVIGTSGKGIDFSATPGTGTSELLADYEEGTWTPTGNSFTVVGVATWTGSYTKIGRLVFWQAKVVATTSITAPAGTAYISMPFTIRGGSYSALGTAADASGFVGLGNGMYVDASDQFYSPAFTARSNVVFSGTYQTDS